MSNGPTRVPGRREMSMVACVAAAFCTLLALRPAGGSEFRYVLSAREMLRAGDWLVPHLGGVPYMEKPILFYWLSAGAQWLLGEGNLAARTPSILGGAALLATTWAFASELRGRTFALAATSLLASAGGFLVLTPALTTDPLLAGTLSITWYALWRCVRGDGDRWNVVFWCAAAAAFLTKGPLAPALVVVAGVAALPSGATLTALRSLRPLRGTAIFLALVLPWNIALWMRELGMGYFIDGTLSGTPLPDDPYDADASTLPTEPWLWSDQRLVAAWSGPGRVWLFASEKDLTHLRRKGATIHEAVRSKRFSLWSNLPIPHAT